MKKALYIALLLAPLAACTSKDPIVDPEPLMTRADSIAAGLIAAVPTADGDWGDTTAYDLNGNPMEGIDVGGVDTELDSPWGE